jgi:hypothetical protein
MKPLRPLLFFVSLLLVVGLACSGGATPPTQAPPPTQPVVIPTNPPPPTEVPPTEELPTEVVVTEEPVSQTQQFFTEEFDNPLSADWDILTVENSTEADADKVTVEAEDGKLIWNFDSEQVFYYLFYNAFNYEDVRLELRADNRGRNNNLVSLICRYDPDEGWYEFNMSNCGEWILYYGYFTNDNTVGYEQLANGGSLAIKQGKDVNEYAIECKGTQLTLFINGEEVTSVNEREYGLRSGQVGISVSSLNVLPILIEMDWVKISES